MRYFLEGLGIGVAIIVGLFLGLVVNKFIERGKQRRKLRLFGRELEINLAQVKTILEEIAKYRREVSSGLLVQSYPYFDFTKFNWSIGTDILNSGLIYEYFDYGDVNKLKEMFWDCSIQMGVIMNDEVKRARETQDRRRADFNIDYWDSKFRKHEEAFRDFLERFKTEGGFKRRK